MSASPLRRFLLAASSIALSVSFSVSQEQSSDTARASSGSLSTAAWYHLEPVSSFTFRAYNMGSSYTTESYTLVNSDGDKLLRRWTPFFAIEGNGDLLSDLRFSYKVQGSRTSPTTLKKASVKYSSFGLSLELARGSVWMGHGYHGSLLLSNNAEPFTYVKFQTENPFSIPYVGKFSYMIFNGWPQNFKLLGQRISWMPFPWIEFGANQTIVYFANYKFWEFFKIMTAANSNIPDPRYNNDQRASLDVAFSLSFLKSVIPPVIDGKIYFEYAGEDLYAVWQPEDNTWVGPLGFDFLDIGNTYGIWLKTDHDEFRTEYSQNYKNNNLFHHFIGDFGYQEYTMKWYGGFGGIYGNPRFINQGSFMGHHMGCCADDLYLEIQHHWGESSIKLMYDRERHGLVSTVTWPWKENKNPEYLFSYGAEISHSFRDLSVSILALWNRYKNVGAAEDLLTVWPAVGKDANAYIIGLTFTYRLNSLLSGE